MASSVATFIDFYYGNIQSTWIHGIFVISHYERGCHGDELPLGQNSLQ